MMNGFTDVEDLTPLPPIRRRQKFRRQLVMVEVDPREVDALIERGYLEPQDRDDREALAAAVNACFSDALITL